MIDPAVSRVLLRTTIVLTILIQPPGAYALDSARTLSQYVHRIWQVQQGLPQASIYAIVQTRDEYLWLGTETGLVKFDGIRFTTVGEVNGVSLANIWVTHLVADANGVLWIGTKRAGLIKLADGKVTRYSKRQGLPDDTVQCLVEDGRGGVWVCTPKGLADVSHETIRTPGPDEGLTITDIKAGCVSPAGGLTVADEGGLVASLNGTHFTSHRLTLPGGASVQTLLCSDDRSLWIGTSDGLFHEPAGGEQHFTLADGLAGRSVLFLTESRDGSLFAGTTNGFSRIRGGEIESFRPQDGLSQSTVYSVHEDREGSLWVATKHGLNQFLDGRAVPYTTSEGLPSNNTGPVFQDRQGTIWVGTLDAGLARFDGRRFSTLTTKDRLPSNAIAALAEGARGELWVGTAAGLVRLEGGRVTGTWTIRQGLPANSVRSLFRDSAGTLWIATSAGVAVFAGGRIRRESESVALAFSRTGVGAALSGRPTITVFGQDRDGRIVALPDPQSSLFRHADAVYKDQDQRLWVGTLGDGLLLVDGDRLFTFSVLDGLFDDVIYGITEDDEGRLWMACSKGIFSVNRSELQQLAAGRIRHVVSSPYSPLDALRTIECRAGVQPAVWRMRDGRLWFSTIRGVLVIDPAHSERHFAAPAAVVEDISVDGERRQLASVGTLPAGRHNVEFGYTGVSFVAPARITFRYMLEGFDRSWVDAGARREAFYTNLPHGQFHFRVAACNPDGACHEALAPVAFAIQPRYYQRAWFVPLCVAALGLGVWMTYRLRIRVLRQQFDLVLAERGRIARELHDTLLQGLAGITMAMQALSSRLPPSAERRTLEEIVGDAGNALREARRSLSTLRHKEGSSSLSASLAAAARQLTDAKGVRLKLTLDELRRELPPDVEDNLIRIAQEAVLNAVNHSGARTVHVSLASSLQHLQLSVKDDGAGFNDEMSPVGHFGLIGMRERAAQIGADFQLTSAPGQGTTVSVVV